MVLRSGSVMLLWVSSLSQHLISVFIRLPGQAGGALGGAGGLDMNSLLSMFGGLGSNIGSNPDGKIFRKPAILA